MIVGGPEGGDSSSSRKAWAQQLYVETIYGRDDSLTKTKQVHQASIDPKPAREVACITEQIDPEEHPEIFWMEEIRSQRRSERNISRENFLALPPPPSSSTPRHDRSQGRGHKGSKVMTLTAKDKEVEYIPYEEGSSKIFEDYNIPPFLKKKSNRYRQNFQWGKNKEIKRVNKAKRKEEEEILEIQIID
nr:uncharacterized protein LOC109168362 [Ipomoea batatas]